MIDNNAFNIHWIEVLGAYGQVDSNVVATGSVFFTVFKNPSTGTLTFTAYNSDTFSHDIVFKDLDGNVIYTMTNVAPGTSRVDQDINGTPTILTQQTSPNFSTPTPQNRFFLATNADLTPTTTHGSTGGINGTGPTVDAATKLDNAILLTNDTPVTISITGLTGTLQGPNAAVYFELWLDAGVRPAPVPNQVAPAVQVTVTFDQFGNGQNVKMYTYITHNLSFNAGFEDPTSFYRSPENGGLTGAIPQYFTNLVNGSVTFTITALNAGTVPIRLRTDAAQQQGDISFIDLPYNFTQVGGTSVENEKSEPQLLFAPPSSLGAVSFALASAAPLVGQSGWTATLTGNTATFTATSVANQTLQITVDPRTNLLMNNRFAVGDPGFNSPYDFDSTLPGDQTLAANATSTVIIEGAGGDSIILGSPRAPLGSPASSLLAAFEIGSSDGTGSLTIDDSVRSASATYTVAQAADGILFSTNETDPTVSRLDVTQTQTFSGGVTLIAGAGTTVTNVLATLAGETLTLDSAAGHAIVNVGNGNVQNILGSVNVTNSAPGGFTDLLVFNFAGVNFSNNVTVSSATTTRSHAGRRAILYSRSSTAWMMSRYVGYGTNATTYDMVWRSPGRLFRTLPTGTGMDSVVVGNNCKWSPAASFPGDLFIRGQSGQLTIENHLGAAVVAA